MYTFHPIPPVYDENAIVLILGSFPSVKSREEGFFYGHPGNRFWRVVSSIFHEEPPKTIEEKKAFLLRNHIAVWDVIHSCRIEGSADASIRDVKPNDLKTIFQKADIKAVYTNGRTAEKYYKKYIEPDLNIKARCLPSTSPANAAWSESRLIEAWQCIKLPLTMTDKPCYYNVERRR